MGNVMYHIEARASISFTRFLTRPLNEAGLKTRPAFIIKHPNTLRSILLI